MNVDDFLKFLDECPTQFHFCAYARSELLKSGFVEVIENEEWKFMPKKSFFIRDGREVIAWNDLGHERAIIAGAHCDSPCLILKPNFDEVVGGYRRCKCNTYGSGLWSTWFDRDLRLAGRVLIKTKEDDKEIIKPVLFDSKVGIACIPCNAPHLGPFPGSSSQINVNMNFIPIYGVEKQSSPLLNHISSKLNVCSEDIVSYDLHFIDSDPSSMIFDQNDYIIHSQRLNGLHNTYAVLKAFINSTPEEGTISMMAVFDNEDAGSKTSAGAAPNVIDSTLNRILCLDNSDYRCFKANSFFVNCKSFHAVTDIFSQIHLGNGIFMQRSSAIEPVSSSKNDYSIDEAIKKIFIESKIGNDDKQITDNNDHFNYHHAFSMKPYYLPQRQNGTYRMETIKEATDDDVLNDNQSGLVFIPDMNTLNQCNDPIYPLIYDKNHDINKPSQQNQENVNLNQINDKENINESENVKKKDDENGKIKDKELNNENPSKITILHRNPDNPIPKSRLKHHFHPPSFSFKDEKTSLEDAIENKFGILSIDIGAPLIGMNSIRELGSFKDIEYEFAILTELFNNYSKYAFPL